MVGNRVEKTMRKASLKTFIGEQWFFPTVDAAVQYCLRHQHAKQQKNIQKSASPHDLEVGASNVHVGNEIGFSNELNHSSTAVFINFVEDVPLIISQITAVFKKHNIATIQAQVDALSEREAKHTYFVKSVKKGSKLSDYEIERVREDLQRLINSCPMESGVDVGELSTEASEGTLGQPTNAVRIDKLEGALVRDREVYQQIQNQLEAQNKRLDAFLSLHSDGTKGFLVV